jgi:hypothetical protein
MALAAGLNIFSFPVPSHVVVKVLYLKFRRDPVFGKYAKRRCAPGLQFGPIRSDPLGAMRVHRKQLPKPGIHDLNSLIGSRPYVSNLFHHRQGAASTNLCILNVDLQ